jgi:hypothetical protein
MKSINEILMDNSGSMNDLLQGNKSKNELAKEIIIEKILPYLSAADNVGIRLFGGKCGIVGQVENIPNANFFKLKEFIQNQIPEPNGKTPLALAIRTAVDNLKKEPHAEREIYLVTDGEDTCGGNIIEAAEYAASNGINCKIHIIGIGELSNEAKQQFSYITKTTGGKNVNIGRKGTTRATIDKELSPFLEPSIDDISDLLDNEYAKRKDTFKYYEGMSIKDYLLRKQLPLNYIPSEQGATCQKLLIIEFFNEETDLDHLIRGIEHVRNCGIINKEVLILMDDWNEDYHSRFFKAWAGRFKNKGVERFCIKLSGFRSYKEIE